MAAALSSAGKGPFMNRLAREKSPYLLQHAQNPVDWHPWGEEAIVLARSTNRLIFLSVGYSTCHWCHVMERESFEDPAIARILNENFVPIKVDREERPDVDRVYMAFVQATTGGGGWPMSVWLTPDLKPVIGGTYFPPTDQHGRPGFKTLLDRIYREWRTNRARLEEQGQVIVETLKEPIEEFGETGPLAPRVPPDEARLILERCYQMLGKMFEPKFGGFSRQPKFPQPVTMQYLCAFAERERRLSSASASATATSLSATTSQPGRGAAALGPAVSPTAAAEALAAAGAASVGAGGESKAARALDMVTTTLRFMARGGIHDHLGYGFHRYSVDGEWHVPHFEKMLYDQGQLVDIYATMAVLQNDQDFERVTERIIEYINRDLSHPAGGFYSGEDADSVPAAVQAQAATSKASAEGAHEKVEKKEGAFYVWTLDEVCGLLDAHLAELAVLAFSISSSGNVDQQKDPHGELRNQNVLIMRHSLEELALKWPTAGPRYSSDQVREKLENITKVLLDVRGTRPRPLRDSKFVTAWNALMISGLARAGRLLQRDEHVARAEKALEFLLTHLYDKQNKQLLHTCYAGEAPDFPISNIAKPIAAFDADYATLVRALLDLFDATYKPRYLVLALEFQAALDAQFSDQDRGGYFHTSGKDSSVLLRLKDEHDGAEPSTNSLAGSNLLRLHRMLDLVDPPALAKLPNAPASAAHFLKLADKLFAGYFGRLSNAPLALPEMARSLIEREALDISNSQLVLVGSARHPTVAQLRARMQRSLGSSRGAFCLHIDPADAEAVAFWREHSKLVADMLASTLNTGSPSKAQGGSEWRLYACQNHTCQLPVSEFLAASSRLDALL